MQAFIEGLFGSHFYKIQAVIPCFFSYLTLYTITNSYASFRVTTQYGTMRAKIIIHTLLYVTTLTRITTLMILTTLITLTTLTTSMNVMNATQ